MTLPGPIPDVVPVDLLGRVPPAADAGLTRSGGNSTVTRITHDGTAYALKDYSRRADGGIRMGREFIALSYLHPRYPHRFARPVAMSSATRRALHTWLPGAPATLDQQSLAALLSVLTELHEGRTDPWAARLPPATDAATAPADIAHQVDQRLTRLRTSTSRGLHDTAARVQRAIGHLSRWDPAPAAASLTLSLSDAGAHNLLADADRYHCVDCEFFGWDDPHKLVCDCLLHPRSHWDRTSAERFLDHVTGIYRLDESRLVSFHGWLAAKWVTIVLARLERMEGSGTVDSSVDAMDDPDIQRLLRILEDPPSTYAALLDSSARAAVPI